MVGGCSITAIVGLGFRVQGLGFRARGYGDCMWDIQGQIIPRTGPCTQKLGASNCSIGFGEVYDYMLGTWTL